VAATGTKQKPNVILCMTDDQGWGDTGYNGNPVLKTPHLDEMARSGIRFDRFYSGAPVCSPTRGSALTGRHPYRYGNAPLPHPGGDRRKLSPERREKAVLQEEKLADQHQLRQVKQPS